MRPSSTASSAATLRAWSLAGGWISRVPQSRKVMVRTGILDGPGRAHGRGTAAAPHVQTATSSSACHSQTSACGAEHLQRIKVLLEDEVVIELHRCGLSFGIPTASDDARRQMSSRAAVRRPYLIAAPTRLITFHVRPSQQVTLEAYGRTLAGVDEQTAQKGRW